MKEGPLLIERGLKCAPLPPLSIPPPQLENHANTNSQLNKSLEYGLTSRLSTVCVQCFYLFMFMFMPRSADPAGPLLYLNLS